MNIGVWLDQALNTKITNCNFDDIDNGPHQLINATAIYIADNPNNFNHSRDPGAWSYYDNGNTTILNCGFEGNTVNIRNHSNTTIVNGYLNYAAIVQPDVHQDINRPGVKYVFHQGVEGNGNNPSQDVNYMPGFVYKGAGVPQYILPNWGTGISLLTDTVIYGECDAFNFVTLSDARVKSDIKPYGRGLKDIMGLEPSTYRYTPQSGTKDNSVRAGFVAQNVQAFIPEAVVKRQDGMLEVSDRPIISALVNAIKEQQQEIEELKKAVAKTK